MDTWKSYVVSIHAFVVAEVTGSNPVLAVGGIAQLVARVTLLAKLVQGIVMSATMATSQ